MRIVAGKFGGRRLDVPKGRDIRPTSDKIRGAVMNMLRSRDALEGADVLDVFCGTGALGLEALSQGAASCVFIDKARESLELARGNAAVLGVEAKFLLKDVAKIGSKAVHDPQATLVFIDPPYGKDLIVSALTGLHEGGWIKDGAWIVCEAERKFQGEMPVFLQIQDERIYGETKILLGRYQAIMPE